MSRMPGWSGTSWHDPHVMEFMTLPDGHIWHMIYSDGVWWCTVQSPVWKPRNRDDVARRMWHVICHMYMVRVTHDMSHVTCHMLRPKSHMFAKAISYSVIETRSSYLSNSWPGLWPCQASMPCGTSLACSAGITLAHGSWHCAVATEVMYDA